MLKNDIIGLQITKKHLKIAENGRKSLTAFYNCLRTGKNSLGWWLKVTKNVYSGWISKNVFKCLNMHHNAYYPKRQQIAKHGKNWAKW